MKNYIAASILSADFFCLGQEIQSVIEAGVDMIHFDVMDNHYVPNLTFGPTVCKSLIKNGVNVPIDVHLMVSPVDSLIEQFTQLGASYITFHPEASHHVHRSLDLIVSSGCKAGLALNPSTPLHFLDHILDKLSMILVMSVNPGFSGQNFIPSTLDKILQLKAYLLKKGYPDIKIEVDGGVNLSNLKEISSVGADIFVMGSALFNSSNYTSFLKSCRKELDGV